MTESLSTVVREIEVPAAARDLCTHDRIGYQNALLAELDSAADRTAEQWACMVTEGASDEMRAGLLAGWSELGAQLGPLDAPDHVLGWPILRAAPEFALLGVTSTRGFRCQTLVMRDERSVLFASFVQFDTDEGRAVWGQVEHMHTPAMSRLLQEAVDRYTG
ncbi:hypothetical protein EV193_101615 [Herbihabitans rhizosphaerae]|uniref:DUF2867 domain-containing protein n=1 Tax=Herbihabitans rhizosphaerae TaxID=1872711 RepID=A0A4Q7L519_9PSEU|nr:hypothetical protein [Herbihabitans rhizosphaerae]RZS44738.1 hypothetical protein EV193_101615 [Herbihabitans rhizosphaerae]